MNTQNKGKDYENELAFKQWLVTFTSTPERLDRLADIGRNCYFNTKVMNVFFAELKMFMTTRKSYIPDYDMLMAKVNRVGKALYLDEFMEDMKRFPNSPQVKKYQFEIMQVLTEVLGEVQEQLSSSEILPKVKRTKKRDPSKAILEGYH